MDKHLEVIAQDILRSKLSGSLQLTELFKYFCKRFPDYSPLAMLWKETLKQTSESKQKDEPSYDWSAAARNACKKLKEALAEYFAETHHLWEWRFELPDAIRKKGYRLELVPQNNGASVTFWRPHLEHKFITLVYAQPMFYIDTLTAMYLRFSNTNPESVSEAAVTELERLHGDVLKKLYGDKKPSDRLRATHHYVGIGEMSALFDLTKWFESYRGVSVERSASDAITSVKETSPVLLGSQRTNKFIKAQLNSLEGNDFHYRFDSKSLYASIRHGRNPDLKPILQRYFSDVYDDTEDDKYDSIVAGNPITTDSRRNRPVILTRMPKPGGEGCVTLIASDTTLAIQQVARALTQDTRAGKILNALGWPENPLPEFFEVLFSVEIASSGVTDHDAEAPKIVLARSAK